ncbi:hemolysin family protein [Zongyangia hominis]|uniref:HlyC/CorC family transporter n=1 Tax=Zongyangia hominis TaxID=2763677 RepID=A0A926EG16_9FIRM|nr:hemolysin family protein [Zongyangia hominis]MBC8571166.1 HlyC/CorC family transporter [Zongyangia hominis]
MEPDGSLWLYILLLVILIGVNAFFAMGEIAIISLNDNKLKKQAGEGNKKAGILLRLTAEPSRFLAAIQVGVTLSGFLASAVAADTFAEYIVYAFRNVPVSPAVVQMVSLIAITILLSYITLIFGELVPKRLAMANSEKISFAIARPLAVIYKVEGPFVALLSASTNGVLRLLGIDPHKKPEEATEEEIRMMVDAGQENGTIEESEKEMIDNVFEFDDRTAGDIMTHRTEMTAVEVHSAFAEVAQAATSSGHSRLPVYEEDLDSIVGIVYLKDLFGRIGSGEPFLLEKLMRKPLFVPETISCAALFGQLKAGRVQIAVVVDEYGGTAGIVTMEDVVEAVMGRIDDEFDGEDEEITQVGEGVFLIDGTADMEQVERLFGIKIDDENDYDTIGGYITGRLGRIPGEAEHPTVSVGGVEFTVLGMTDRRVDRVQARRIPVSVSS